MRKRQFTSAAVLLAAGAVAAPLLPGLALARRGGVPALLLAQKAPDELEVGRYLVSEKFDGVRAYWDGRLMWSRQGLPIALPPDIASQLPGRPLDGELWMGRGRFEQASAAVRRIDPRPAEWAQMSYLIFELPLAPGGFEQRYAALRELLANSAWRGLRAVEQSRVADRRQLDARLAETVRGGGEGLVLHEAAAPYLTGRSPVLLKLKPEDDDEALVLAHEPGEGRFDGMMGALLVRNAAGQTFRIGTGFSEAQRRSPPPVGATITYRHRGVTGKGLPRFASFLRQTEP